MVTKAFAGLLSALLLSANGCLVTGCASTERTPEHQKQAIEGIDTTLRALEQARAKGRFQFRHGGSPFQAWMKNENAVGIGSNAMAVEVDVDVDFTQAPRVGPASDPALHASLPPELADVVGSWNALPPHQPTVIAIERAIDKLDKKIALRLGETRADSGP